MSAPAWSPRLARVLPHAWSVVLPLALLGPALAPGYVLSYDMVWVPHLAMRTQLLGAGSGYPRAVPSDAVVSVLDHVVPGMVLQKLVLLGALLLVGQGVLRLVGPSLTARLVAVSVAVWNPFVAERLWIGHWPVLLGYGVLPWLVVLARRLRLTGRVPPALWLLVPLGSLSASAGIVSAAVVLVCGLTRRRGVAARVVVVILAGNAPWVVTGLLHGAGAGGGIAARLFAPHAQGSMPAPLSALTLGGIWNTEVVPGSQQGPLGWVLLAGLVLLAGCGARAWWRTPDARRLALLWIVGYAVVLLTWLLPGALDRLGGSVPAAGLLRDGARYLGLCLPALVGTTAVGAERLVRAARDHALQLAVVIVATVLPVAAMPDAVAGLTGALRAVHYPRGWATARAELASAERADPGEVLVLPFTSYRQPSWNGDHKVLDPLGRYLTPDYLASDVLVVSGRTAPSDDPQVARAARALRLDDAAARARALRGLGIRYVVTERDVAARPGQAPTVGGDPILTTTTLRVVRLDGAVAEQGRDATWWAVVGLAWAVYAGSVVTGVVGTLRSVVRRRRRADLSDWPAK